MTSITENKLKSTMNKNIGRDYRQVLLDVPQQEGFPTNIVWPVQP